MSKRVLDVGNCNRDHGAIRALIETNFDAQVVRAHTGRDAATELQQGAFHLVLVNRLLDRDGSDGLEVIRQVKSCSDTAGTPCMLISNYAEYQELARQAGAEPGFGKAELSLAQTVEKLRPFLG
jgi:CheY-like chemotaxis protein